MYKGVAAVPPLLMVDDILTISKCSSTARAMNATVNALAMTSVVQFMWGRRKEKPRLESSYETHAQRRTNQIPGRYFPQ